MEAGSYEQVVQNLQFMAGLAAAGANARLTVLITS
jgi:hypothetical protein